MWINALRLYVADLLQNEFISQKYKRRSRCLICSPARNPGLCSMG